MTCSGQRLLDVTPLLSISIVRCRERILDPPKQINLFYMNT